MCLKHYFVISLFTCFMAFGASAIKTFYLDELCGSSVEIHTTAQVKVKTTRSSFYDDYMNCRVNVNGIYRFMIQFKDLHIERGDKLRITENPFSKLIGGREFSGFFTPSTVYASDSSTLQFTFTSDFAVAGKGFYIVLTQYTTEPCNSNQYQCNADRCVNSTVECGDLSPCDPKNCPQTKASGKATGVAILVLIIIAIIFSIFCTVFGLYLRFRPGAVNIFRVRRDSPIGLAAAIEPIQPVARSFQSAPFTPQSATSTSYPKQQQSHNPIYGQPMQHQTYEQNSSQGQPVESQYFNEPVQNLQYNEPVQNQSYRQTVENPLYGQPVQKPGLYVIDGEGKEIDPS